MRRPKPPVVLLLILIAAVLLFAVAGFVVPRVIQARGASTHFLRGFTYDPANVRYDVLMYVLVTGAAAILVAATINPLIRKTAGSLLEATIDVRLKVYFIAVAAVLPLCFVLSYGRKAILLAAALGALVLMLERLLVYREVSLRLWQWTRAMTVVFVAAAACTYIAQVNAFIHNMPNDYLELPDYLRVPVANAGEHYVLVNGNTILECLYGVRLPLVGDAAVGSSPKRCSSLPEIGEHSSTALLLELGWKSQAGRLLYHHSYVFDPAMQMNDDRTLPEQNLYGLLNTGLFALSFHVFGESLHVYFVTYVAGIALGLLAFALFVASFGDHRPSIALACLPAALFLPAGILVVALAPGLSPLRFIGALGVLYGAFSLLRLREARPLKIGAFTLLIALGSLWNTEWALLAAAALALGIALGVTAGWVSMRSPTLFGLGIAAAVPAISIAATEGQFSTVQYTFLGLVTQPIDVRAFAAAVALTTVVTAILLFSVRNQSTVKKVELSTLICFATLSLSKAVWNPVASHFFSICPILSLPVAYALAMHDGATAGAMRARLASSIVLAGFCVVTAASAIMENKGAIALLSAPFQRFEWKNPRANIQTSFDPAAVEEAAKLIRKYSSAGSIFVVSPYDHLLYFISGRSPAFPTHELMTNLVSERELQSFKARFLERRPRYFFASEGLFRALHGIEMPADQENLDLGSVRSRMKLADNLRRLLCEVSEGYVVRERGALISVYEHVGDGAPHRCN